MSQELMKDIELKLKDRPVGVIGKRREYSVLIPLVEIDGNVSLLFEVRS